MLAVDAPRRARFEKAAAQNHGGALERLGAYAQEGRAGPKDEKAALAFYEKAANLSSDEAADSLERQRCHFTLRDKTAKLLEAFATWANNAFGSD